MQINVELPQADVDFIDTCAGETGTSRSAVLHHAVGLLRETRLEYDYAAAWAEWEASGEAALWERSAG